MSSNDDEFGMGVKMAAVAVVCAVLTATAVIGAGQALLSRSSGQTSAEPTAQLIRTSN